MKNFRKVLALVLVVATLFSFVAMASAKTLADYSDAADVQYKEAVDVLTAIGILKGYDGKYHANDPIDRDEIAKMIAVLRNAGVDNSALFTGANTFADVKGTWAEGYIAYAAQVGIVNGRNATTFDPDAKVTGVEVMKMLLCVLGYDAKLQGYVGANWQVNVMRDAVKMGLTAGLKDFDPYKAATRDEAAQMMFNALKAYMIVGYVSENIVKVTNSIYNFNLKDKELDLGTPDTNKYKYEMAYCNAVMSKVPLYKIIADLTLTETTYDCYHRPGHTWTYGKDYEAFFVDTAIKTQSEGGFDTDLVAKTEIWENGKPVQVAVAGNGVVVEYYDNITVVIKSFIDEVVTVNPYYNYFKLKSGKQFDLNDYAIAEGDKVLVWLCGEEDGLHDVKVVAPTAVEITEGVNYKNDFEGWNASYVTAGGKNYKYAAHLGLWLADQDRMTFTSVKDSNKYDLYLDEFGFIKYYEVTAPAAVETYYTYIVEGSVKSHNHGYATDAAGKDEGIVSWTADFVNYGTDGTLSVSDDVASAKNVKETLVNYSAKYLMGALAEVYTENDVVNVKRHAEFATVGTELNNNTYVLKDKEVYANSKTIFMIRTKNLDGSYTYEQVTGYKNLKGNYVAKALDAEKTNIQYFTNPDHPAFATYVFIDAVYTRDFDCTFISLGEADFYKFETRLQKLYADDYAVYTVLVDGKEAVVVVANELFHDGLHTGELKNAVKYTATLAYLGVTVTVEGKELPIYSVVNELPKVVNDVIPGCVYEVVEGETYIWFENDIIDDAGNKIAEAKKMYTLAEDAVVLTLTANKVDGKYVTDIYEGILDLKADDTDAPHVIKYCYVTIVDGVVTELVRVDDLFIQNI